MIEKFDIIIVGGGAAGLFAAAHTPSTKTLLLDGNANLGRKLAISGSGRCNFTHEGSMDDFLKHYGNHAGFIKFALHNFSNDKLIEYFKQHNLDSYIDKNGKYFPVSDDAEEIVSFLIQESLKRKVVIKTNERVISVTKSDDIFIVSGHKKVYHSNMLIIATGGLSYPNTGCQGDGYTFATSNNINVTKRKPALTPIYFSGGNLSQLAGITIQDCTIELYRKLKKIHTHSGDIVFTHKGISGPGILDISRYFEKDDVLKFNFCSETDEKMQQSFIQHVALHGSMSIKTFLRNYSIPASLVEWGLTQLGIQPNAKIGTLTKIARQKTIQYFCGYEVIINAIGGYNIAMVTTGGIDLSEINPKTMEAKKCKGLYFIGEVLDIDGDTGGYNIQAAFSTAYQAMFAISKSFSF